MTESLKDRIAKQAEKDPYYENLLPREFIRTSINRLVLLAYGRNNIEPLFPPQKTELPTSEDVMKYLIPENETASRAIKKHLKIQNKTNPISRKCYVPVHIPNGENVIAPRLLFIHKLTPETGGESPSDITIDYDDPDWLLHFSMDCLKNELINSYDKVCASLSHYIKFNSRDSRLYAIDGRSIKAKLIEAINSYLANIFMSHSVKLCDEILDDLKQSLNKSESQPITWRDPKAPDYPYDLVSNAGYQLDQAYLAYLTDYLFKEMTKDDFDFFVRLRDCISEMNFSKSALDFNWDSVEKNSRKELLGMFSGFLTRWSMDNVDYFTVEERVLYPQIAELKYYLSQNRSVMGLINNHLDVELYQVIDDSTTSTMANKICTQLKKTYTQLSEFEAKLSEVRESSSSGRSIEDLIDNLV